MAGRIRAKSARVHANHTASIFKETNKNSQKWVSPAHEVRDRKLGQSAGQKDKSLFYKYKFILPFCPDSVFPFCFTSRSLAHTQNTQQKRSVMWSHRSIFSSPNSSLFAEAEQKDALKEPI